MILEMFILLMGISAFFAWYGYYTKIRAFSVVGLSIFFLLGAWIILYNYTNQDAYGLQYKTGSILNTTGGVTVVSYTYATYNDNTAYWVGYLLSIISAVGIFLVAVNDQFS